MAKRKKKEAEVRSNNIRLTPTAHRLVAMLAAALGMSISDTLEAAIREKYPHIAEAADKTVTAIPQGESEDEE